MENNIDFQYTINNPDNINCIFELNASGTVWGNIVGNIANQTDLQEALNSKQDVLTAGDNIQITNGVISATDTTYTAGTGISIENGVISNTQISAIWGNIQGTLSNQTDLQNTLDLMNEQIEANHEEIGEIGQTIGTYGDIVTYNAANFATFSQGLLANTALQPNDNISELNNNVGYITSAALPTDYVPETRTINGYALTSNIILNYSDVGALSSSTTINDLTTTSQLNALNSGATTTNIGQIATNTSDIANINALIPAQASTSNQLADKDFVNSSIATNTANFIGTFNSVAELEAYSGTLTNNDYAFVATTDSAGNTLYDRYKYNADTQQWIFEYELNNSSFTAQQWASINSGITSGDVTLIGTALQPNDNISELTNDMGYVTTIKGGTDINVVRHTSLLPNGYTQLDYIESTGTQYIDTGYKPSNATKVKTRFSVQEPLSFVFGSRNSTSGANQKRFGLHLSNLELGSHWVVQYANTNNSISNYELNIVYDVEMSENGFYVDGTKIYSLQQRVFTGDYNMYLFANNTADTSTQYGSVKIYSFQIYDNNILIHDYIPCKNSSNVIGMYDIVTNTFFTNAGTGDFVAGLVSATYYILFSNESGYITNSALSGYATETWVGNQGYQATSNLVTSISSSSTDAQYPSAKCVYDIVGDIESILHNINSGS